MIAIKDLNRFEIELICWKEGFENLLPFIRSLSQEEVKPRILEILRICTETGYLQNIHWREWYRLSKMKLEEKPTVRKTYYYPGYCFQRKFRELWDTGFEYRYARRTSIRTFLLSCQRKSHEFHVNLSADLCSYILSFLRPHELGIQVETTRKNLRITKKKNYLVETFRVNHCRVGHTNILYNSCPHCAALEEEYLDISGKLNLDIEELPDEYQMNQEFDMSLPRRKLEMDLMKIKHEIKLERLNQRAHLRLEMFRNC